jgi:acyl transferase domain-containing protein
VDNLLSQVRLEPAIRAALGVRPTLFVEISPHPVLLGAVGDTIDAASATATITPSLRHGSPEVEALLTSLAEAYVLGCDPAWDRVHAGGRHVPVPN